MATEGIPEEDSILNNLSKTRQLWSSKADITSTECLFPKSPTTTSSTKKPRYSTSSESAAPTEVVKADEQIIEDYELPDIKSMKSQFEASGDATPVPKPIQRAPSVKHKPVQTQAANDGPAPVPVNREETEEEEYHVELGSLRAQFEEAAKNASTSKSSQRKSPVPKASIKDHVTKSNQGNARQAKSKKVVKKTRFEDEISLQNKSSASAEPRAEEDGVSVDLRSLKSQFESRPDQKPVNPSNQDPVKKRQSISSSSAVVTSPPPASEAPVENGVSSPPDVVRPEDPKEEEHYEVELGALRKRFEENRDNVKSSPPPKKTPSTPVKKEAPIVAEVASPKESAPVLERQPSSTEDSPRVETVKSYEPVYEEMIGEESVKDRLKSFQAMAKSTNKQTTTVQRKPSQKKPVAPPVAKEPEPVAAAPEEDSPASESIEVVRSPPAGSKITPDYIPSIDLQQAKSLFSKDEEQPPSSPRRSSLKRRSTSSSISEVTPSRTGRSSRSSDKRRNSSYHSSASPSGRSGKSSSPAPSSTREHPRSPSAGSAISDSDMSQVVKPAPAGTKETPDYTPSLNISSVKSMFENSQKATSPTSGGAPKPRRQLNSNWMNGNESEANKTTQDRGSRRVVAEGSYEERAGGVVRPPTAGTKEKPAYSLSSDFLKSRAAMFDGPKEQSYQPRNKLQTPTKANQAEVVNQAGASEDVGYKLSENQMKDTKKMFESGGTTSPTQSSSSRDESDIVRASDMGSAKKLFEQGEQADQPEPVPRKQPIDIKQEAMEAVNRDREVQQEAPVAEPPTNEESKESESESEGEYLLDKDQNQGGEAAEEQAAAVTPVRVAVPSPEPAEEQSYVEPQKEEEAEKPQEQEQEEASYQQEEEKEEPEVQQQGYEAPAEEPTQDYKEPEEEYTPPAQEEQAEDPEPVQEQPAEASSIVTEDHLLRQEPEQSEDEPPKMEEAYQAEEEQKEQETQQEEEPVKQEETYNNVPEESSYNDEATTNGNGYQDEQAPTPDAKDSYAAAPEEDSAPVKAAPAAGATENGGLAILQDTDGGSYLE